MNKKVKTKWIEALRSGNYSQDRKKLRTLEGYCCLGVLCDLYAKESDGTAGWIKGNAGYEFKIEHQPGFDQMPPNDVLKWADFYDFDEIYFLANLNDQKKKDFAYIANHIEEQV